MHRPNQIRRSQKYLFKRREHFCNKSIGAQAFNCRKSSELVSFKKVLT